MKRLLDTLHRRMEHLACSMVVRPDVDAFVATHVTAEDLATLEDDGYRYDLLAGSLIRMAPAGFEHGRLALRIAARLVVFLDGQPQLGVAVGAETGFRLARNPDTVWRQMQRWCAPTACRRLKPGAATWKWRPTWWSKIVSPSDHWTTVSEKVNSYLAAGVRLCGWSSRGARAVRVYTAEGAERHLRVEHGDMLEAEPVLPGFHLPLTELFATVVGATAGLRRSRSLRQRARAARHAGGVLGHGLSGRPAWSVLGGRIPQHPQNPSFPPAL